MPLATAKAVITQVPWSVETPRLPAMVGSETLAMVESSTCMKVPNASANAVIASGPPFSGATAAGAAGARASAVVELADIRSVLRQDFGDQRIGDGALSSPVSARVVPGPTLVVISGPDWSRTSASAVTLSPTRRG